MRFRIWPGIIFVLLGANMAIVAVTVVAAKRSASPIEPDYYARALRWDSGPERDARNRALGWRVEASATRSDDGTVRLVARIFDGSDRPLRAATRVEARRVGDAGAGPVELVGAGDGTYAGVIAGTPGATLEVRFAVEAGYDLFTHVQSVPVVPADRGRTP